MDHVVILIKSVFNENDNLYYYKVFLENVHINHIYYMMIKFMFLKLLILIR